MISIFPACIFFLDQPTPTRAQFLCATITAFHNGHQAAEDFHPPVRLGATTRLRRRAHHQHGQVPGAAPVPSPLVLRSGGVCISRRRCAGRWRWGTRGSTRSCAEPRGLPHPPQWPTPTPLAHSCGIATSQGEIVDGHGGSHHVDTIFDAVFRPHADGSAGIRVTAVEDEKLTAEMTVRRHPSVASTPLPSQSHPVLWCRWKRAT